MELHAYCVAHGGHGKRGCPVLIYVARIAGCGSETLYMISGGHKKAGPKLAGAIERATSGAVTRYELRPDIFGLAPKSEEAA